MATVKGGKPSQATPEVTKQAEARPFAEIGSTGLSRWGGRVVEEPLLELRGARGARVFREMRENDAVIGASLTVIERLMRQVEWRVEPPPGGDQADADRAAFVQTALDDMSASWSATLSDVLSILVYGWAWLEVIYKRRLGDSRDPSKRSRYTDGRIGWRKWAIRAQESLYEWRFDEEGGVQAMVQLDPSGVRAQAVPIPIEKSLLFRTTAARGNPEGRSLLRSAYRAWYFKKNIEVIEGIGVERDLAGYPVIRLKEVAPDVWNAKDPAAVDLKDKLERFIRSVRVDEQMGAIVPSWVEFDLLRGGARSFPTGDIIERLSRHMAMTLMTDVILLGHERVGSLALASSKTELLGLAIGGMLDDLADTINRHEIPRLYRLNGWPADRAATLAHGDVETPDLAELAAYVTALANTGALEFPDEALSRYLRAAASLPEPEVGADGENGGPPAAAKRSRPRLVRLSRRERQLVELLAQARQELGDGRG